MNEPITRHCKKCDQEKPLTEFQKDKKCNFGRSYRCKACVSLRCKNYYANSPQAKKKSNLRVRYKLEMENYETMITSQDSKCKLCGKNTELVVDHAHNTGKVRGLLCHKCNISLAGLEYFLSNCTIAEAFSYINPAI